MNPAKTITALLLLALLTPGCSTLQSAFSSDPADPTYAADAEQNMRLGIDALENKNFPEAEKYFEYVRSKYPFLEAAREAELRLADTEFEKEEHSTAREKYQGFIKLHPTHAKVDYAAFRSALTHYKQIPSDFFILPPSYEKDQTEVKNAVRAMNEFIRQYPESKYVPEAKKLAEDARRRLGEHELYVAGFYARREKWPAVIRRLKTVVESYAGLGLAERALFGLHEAYLKLGDEEQAKEALRRIVSELPGTPAAERAQKLLGG